MEDVIEKDPMAAYPPDQDNVTFQTGDRVIDAWEREIAKGNTPDLAAAFEGNAEVQAWLKPKKKGDGSGGGGQPPSQRQALPLSKPKQKTDVPTSPPELDLTELDFHDDFTGGLDGKP